MECETNPKYWELGHRGIEQTFQIVCSLANIEFQVGLSRESPVMANAIGPGLVLGQTVKGECCL